MQKKKKKKQIELNSLPERRQTSHLVKDGRAEGTNCLDGVPSTGLTFCFYVPERRALG